LVLRRAGLVATVEIVAGEAAISYEADRDG